VEDDVTGDVGETQAEIVSPEGEKIGRINLADGPEVFSKLRAMLKADVAKHEAEPEPTPPAPQAVVYRGTTGDREAVDSLRGFQTREWSLIVSHYIQSGAVVQLLAPDPDGRVIENVPVEPRETLTARVAMAIRAHYYRNSPGAAEVAATVEPDRRADHAAAEQPDPGDAGAVEIPLDLIDDLPGGNHRRTYDPEKMDELVALVREHGVIEPVLVRRAGKHYQLIAGYRRREAARRAGLTTIPARIRKCSVADARMEMLVENRGREDLNPMDLANALGELVDREPGRPQEEIARAAGMSRSSLTEYLRLRKLPKALHPAVASGAMAVKTAVMFLAEASELSEADREKAGAMLAASPPSYRQAPDVIHSVIQSVSHRPAARAAAPAQPGHSSPSRPV
jgi:ParB/RepB/Spo0J family partition protein